MNAVIADLVQDTSPVPLSRTELAGAKAAWTTRRIDLSVASQLLRGGQPRSGDLLLARVLRIGQHTGLQLTTGRRATLFVDDLVIVACADRYAPDQFEARVPEDLGACDLAAAGGIAARVRFQHARMRSPTRLQPIGLLADARGRVLNVADGAVPPPSSPPLRLPVIAVVGASMNAGKTTTVAHLIRGLVAAGLRVGAAKVTGTGACGDTMLMRDAGAAEVLDFLDAGYASTYQAPMPQLERAALRLIDTLCVGDVDVVVVELADGVFQAETSALMRSHAFANRLAGTLFASGDALGAAAGVDWLERHEHRVLAVAGALTASPLAAREAETATGLPVMTLAQLGCPERALDLYRLAAARATLRSVR